MAQPENYSFATVQDHVGHDFGLSDPVVVDQPRINTFADATDDHQWIHVDAERARAESPFGGTVAHGFLTLSLVAGMVGAAGAVPADVRAVVNYGVENVRFLAPVPAGASIRARFTLAGVDVRDDGRKLMRISASVAVEGSDKPALIGDFLALIVG